MLSVYNLQQFLKFSDITLLTLTAMHDDHSHEVTTHTARHQFEYQICTDETSNLQTLDEHSVTVLRLKKLLKFADDATQQQYREELEQFKQENDKDDRQEVTEELSIEGFKDYILAFSTDDVQCKTKWMKARWFLFFSVIGLGPCFKRVLVESCGKMALVMTKKIRR